MSFQGQVEASKRATDRVTAQGICATLKNNSLWSERFHHFLHNWSEKSLVAFIGDALLQWDVDCVKAAFTDSNILNRRRLNMTENQNNRNAPCAWKEPVTAVFVVFISVKRDCHHSIGGVESLLHSITLKYRRSANYHTTRKRSLRNLRGEGRCRRTGRAYAPLKVPRWPEQRRSHNKIHKPGLPAHDAVRPS